MRIFVRHGQSEFNVKGVYNEIPIPENTLTEKGVEDIKVIAKKLKQYTVDKIIHSEFPRTKQTAEIISEELNLPLKEDSRISERKLGADSKNIREFKQAHSIEEINKMGEGLDMFKKRIFEFLEVEETNNSIVATHLDVIRVVYAKINNISDEKIHKIFIDGETIYQ